MAAIGLNTMSKKDERIVFGLLFSLFLAGCPRPPRPYEIESEQKSPAGTVLASVTRQAYGGRQADSSTRFF
jgi:hypothetical protein